MRDEKEECNPLEMKIIKELQKPALTNTSVVQQFVKDPQGDAWRHNNVYLKKKKRDKFLNKTWRYETISCRYKNKAIQILEIKVATDLMKESISKL